MKLSRVEVRNYRSIFEHTSTERGLRLDVASGLNVMVGRNNCGKSNLFRAIAAALDPAYEFDIERDVPGPMPHRYPSIQLWFTCDPTDPEEKALLHSAREYEQHAMAANATRADRSQIVLRVTYAPTETGVADRRERLVFLDGSDEPRSPSAAAMLPEVIEQFRSLVRFVMVSSGESIKSVLEGNFREILHSVVQEHMGEEFSAAEEHRQEYIKGLQAELLGPLRENVRDSIKRLFPEIADIHFAPDVSDIESTLAHVEISLEDAVTTPLSEKGTGVRGGVLVAMLRYLAANTNRCVVMAVEEPEAFLHPAAQEDLREDLESLASRDDVSVLVTTHSPFVISREHDAMSFFLDKDREGRTFVAESSVGGDPTVSMISGIVREESFEDLLRATSAIGSDKAAVLMVEGEGDKHYLELVAKTVGQPGLLADIEIVPTHGTTKMVYRSLVASAATGLPVAVLLDADEPGIKAKNELGALKNPNTKKNSSLFSGNQLVSYSAVFPGDIRGNFAWEAEDLFPTELTERFVASNGGLESSVVLAHEKRPTGLHVDMDHLGKKAFGAHLERELSADHCERWLELIAIIRAALGLPEHAEVDDIVAVGQSKATPVTTGNEPETGTTTGLDIAAVRTRADVPDERVLIVSQNFGHAEYLRSHVFVGEPGRGLSPSIRYVGFYESGEIREEIPAVRARHDDLVFTYDLADRLAISSSPDDVKLSVFIREELDTGRRAPGETRQVFLLTEPEDPRTLTLRQPVQNTKLSPKGKPMAWVVRHALTWKNALVGGAATTDELDAYEEENKQ